MRIQGSVDLIYGFWSSSVLSVASKDAYYFLWVNLHPSSKTISHKEVIEEQKSRFLLFFCFLMEGSGSGRPKNKRIRIRFTLMQIRKRILLFIKVKRILRPLIFTDPPGLGMSLHASIVSVHGPPRLHFEPLNSKAPEFWLRSGSRVQLLSQMQTRIRIQVAKIMRTYRSGSANPVIKIHLKVLPVI